MSAPVALYTEADVRDALTVETVIEAVQAAVEREHSGLAQNIAKTMTTWSPKSSAHALGAFDSVDGFVGFKTWVNTPAGAAAQLTLFDSTNGKLLASMSAGYLGAFRTAAISGVATRSLSAPDADELAIIGTGRQALLQVRAVHAVRPLRRVRVWSRTAEHGTSFAEQVQAALGVEATATDSVGEAVDGAPIVTLITRASEPFLSGELLAGGAHLNAVGAILPANAEFEPGLLDRAQVVVVDSLENAKLGSRELREHYGDDWSDVHTLGDVLAGKVTRSDGDRLTVFKPLGMGLSDLAAAIAFVRIAQERLADA